MTKNKNRARKPRLSRRRFPNHVREVIFESDGSFILKLIASLILGSIWLKFGNQDGPSTSLLLGLPIGAIVAMLLVRQFEKHQLNRKFFYTVIVIAAVLATFYPTAIYI